MAPETEATQEMQIGETKTYGRVTVEKRMSDFMAFLDGDKSVWESGASQAEAIGKLVISHPEISEE